MPNPSIKCEKVYRALLRDGYDKETSARISNAMARRGKCGGKRKEMSAQTETTKEHTGIMVALFVPYLVAQGIAASYRDAFDLSAVVTPADELHMTLMYLGDSTNTEYDAPQLAEWLAEWARGQEPLKGVLSGLGRFNHTTSDGVPVYLSFDSVHLPEFRQSLVDCFRDKGLAIEFNHGFTPHITLAYTPNVRDGWIMEVPQQEITFNEITLAFGDERFNMPLGNVGGRFFVTKDAKGEPRWVLVSSSAYVDRDGEIVTEKALARAVERMDATGDYGDLRWWHTPAVLGKADYAAIHAHSLIESGTFATKEIAARVMAAAGKLGASIGFRHPASEPKNKEYSDITILERSLLPRGKESNLYTALRVVQGGEMEEVKKAALVELIGEQEAATVLARMEATAKEADDAGVTRKEKGLLGRFMDWLNGQEEFKEVDGEDIVTLTVEADEEAATADAGAEAEEDAEAGKAAKADDDEDDDPEMLPVTRAELKAALAAIRKEITGAKAKEADAPTKADMEALKAELDSAKAQAEAAEAKAEKAAKAAEGLAGDLPRGLASVFRASQASDTATDKAEQAAEKAKQVNDPLVEWVNGKYGA